MGHRLSAIATRTGDAGSTGLGDGTRVSKTDARVAAMGDVDELNSAVGLLLAFGIADEELGMRALLQSIQQDLLDIGGELSIPGYSLLPEQRVRALDAWLAQANAALPRLAEFIMPGGSLPGAQAHVCRTVARRAERALLVLAERDVVTTVCRQYLNRLSDILFVMARVLNLRAAQTESLWATPPGRMTLVLNSAKEEWNEIATHRRHRRRNHGQRHFAGVRSGRAECDHAGRRQGRRAARPGHARGQPRAHGKEGES
ncbi:MAG: cob(I)yrinic acid a,c-diamide adenosyltransferase [Acidobacteriaceae bacterium]